MSKGFKGALCLALIPGAYQSYWNMCHRHSSHPGSHRVAFRDGTVMEWATGDYEAKVK